MLFTKLLLQCTDPNGPAGPYPYPAPGGGGCPSGIVLVNATAQHAGAPGWFLVAVAAAMLFVVVLFIYLNNKSTDDKTAMALMSGLFYATITGVFLLAIFLAGYGISLIL